MAVIGGACRCPRGVEMLGKLLFLVVGHRSPCRDHLRDQSHAEIICGTCVCAHCVKASHHRCSLAGQRSFAVRQHSRGGAAWPGSSLQGFFSAAAVWSGHNAWAAPLLPGECPARCELRCGRRLLKDPAALNRAGGATPAAVAWSDLGAVSGAGTNKINSRGSRSAMRRPCSGTKLHCILLPKK